MSSPGGLIQTRRSNYQWSRQPPKQTESAIRGFTPVNRFATGRNTNIYAMELELAPVVQRLLDQGASRTLATAKKARKKPVNTSANGKSVGEYNACHVFRKPDQ